MKKGFLGILALTLIFGMTVISCGDGDGNGNNGTENGNGNNGNENTTTGSLTIDGLPNTGIRAVYLFNYGTDISTFNEIVDAYTNGQYIAVGASADSNNTFPLFRWLNTATVEESFSSSGVFPVLLLNTAGSITDSTNPMYSWALASFNNSKGTINFSQFEAVTDDSLALLALASEILALPVNTSDSPHNIILNVNLKSLASDGDPLGYILTLLNSETYIALDLSGCKGTDITRPSGSSSFSDRRKYIVSLKLPDTVRNIRSYSFTEYNFKSLILPSQLQEIGTVAFQGCNFSLIDIPASVNLVGDAIFYVTSETIVIVRASVPPNAPQAGQYIFSGVLPGQPTMKGDPKVIYVPDNNVNAYKSAQGWNQYSDIIKPISEKP